MLQTFCDPKSMTVVVVEGDPISKARPRFSQGGHAYTPKKTILGEKAIAARVCHVQHMHSNVAMACIFYRSTRQRIDVDNMMKAVLDGCTRAGIWDDDSQVTALVGVVEHDKSRPRTVVAFGAHQSTLTRGRASLVACVTCGKEFFPSGARRRDSAKWCSRKCSEKYAEPVPCPQCGVSFKRKTGSKFCSVACRGKAQSEKDRAARLARTHCRHGHELDETNTHVLSGGRKRCRKCQAEAAAKSRVSRLEERGDAEQASVAGPLFDEARPLTCHGRTGR